MKNTFTIKGFNSFYLDKVRIIIEDITSTDDPLWIENAPQINLIND
jgi:hypothetical protein